MNTLLKLGIGAVAFIVLYGLAAPLAFFITDLIQNPGAFRVELSVKPLNETHALLTVTVAYNGSVELQDVTVGIQDINLALGDLSAGAIVSKSAIVSTSELLNLGNEVRISFSIMGLYPIELSIRRA